MLLHIFSDPLQWDRAGHDPVFDLMYSQRKLQKADKILADKREWVKQEHKKIQMQWDDLYEKEMKLNHTFRKLSHVSRGLLRSGGIYNS